MARVFIGLLFFFVIVSAFLASFDHAVSDRPCIRFVDVPAIRFVTMVGDVPLFETTTQKRCVAWGVKKTDE